MEWISLAVLKRLFVFSFLSIVSLGSLAEDRLLSPYILSSNVQADRVKAIIEVKDALSTGGFQIVGEYAPDTDRHVIVVTSDYLKKLAQTDIGALFATSQRIGITQVKNKVQVAYTNPLYFKYAYRVKGDMSRVTQQMQEILGAQEAFGSKGISQETLASFKYSFGMESFDDFLLLGQFSSHSLALKRVEQNFLNFPNRLEKIFRIDIPGAAASVFGVSIKQGEGGDQTISYAVDSQILKHTPRLPYTVVVRRGRVFALHPRFKLPLDFPDLERTGSYSFTRIIKAPEAIEKALRLLTAGA